MPLVNLAPTSGVLVEKCVPVAACPTIQLAKVSSVLVCRLAVNREASINIGSGGCIKAFKVIRCNLFEEV